MLLDSPNIPSPHGGFAKPEPTTLGELWNATWERSRKVENDRAYFKQLWDEYDTQNDEILKAGGPKMFHPLRDAPSAEDYQSLAEEARNSGGAVYLPQWMANKYNRQLREAAEKHPHLRAIIKADDPPDLRVAKRVREVEERTGKTIEGYGFLQPEDFGMVGRIPILGSAIIPGAANVFYAPRGTATSFGATAWSWFRAPTADNWSPIDAPGTIMSMGVGGLMGKPGLSIVKNALRNATANAAQQAALEPGRQLGRKAVGLDYGWENAAESISGAFGMGLGIDPLVRGSVRGLRKAVPDINIPLLGKVDPAELGGVFRDVPERIPDIRTAPDAAPPPVPPPSPELIAGIRNNDPAAIREAVKTYGLDADPTVRGALHAEEAGAVTQAHLDEVYGPGAVDSGEAYASLLRSIQALEDPDAPPQVRAIEAIPEARSVIDDPNPREVGSNQHGDKFSVEGKEVVRREVDLKTLPLEREIAALKAEAQMSRDMLGRVMLYERLDGSIAVLDGNKRVGLAQASPEADVKVPAIVLKESAGWTEGEARAMAARENIRLGDRQDPVDIARQIRETPGLIDRSVEITAPVAIARALAKLSEDAFEMVRRGEASVMNGVAVADHVADPGRHAAMLRELQALGPEDVASARAGLAALLPPDEMAVTDAMMGVQRTDADRERPLDGGSKIDDPMGAEAKKQTQLLEQNLAREIADAKARPERVAKAVEKTATKIDKLRQEIAELEAQRLEKADTGAVTFEAVRNALPLDENGDANLAALTEALAGRAWRDIPEPERLAIAERIAPDAPRQAPDEALSGKIAKKREELRAAMKEKAALEADSSRRLAKDAERARKVHDAIERLAGIVPEGIAVRTFDRVADLPAGIAEAVIAENQKAMADAVIGVARARTPQEQAMWRARFDQAQREQVVEGMALADTIWIATYAAEPEARLAHETVHALKNKGLLQTDDIGLLATRARELGVWRDEAATDYLTLFNDRAARSGLDGPSRAEYMRQMMDEEAAAHLIDAHMRGMDVSEPQARTILERVAEALRRLREFFRGQNLKTADDVIEAILSGEAARRELVRRAEVPAAALVGPLSRYQSEGEIKAAMGPMMAMSDAATGRDMRRALDNLGYYSKALEAAKSLKQAKGTPEQMLAQLKSAGVKDAEIEATGLRSILDGKPSITRDEIVSHLEGNRVGLREVAYSGELAQLNTENTTLSQFRNARSRLGLDDASSGRVAAINSRIAELSGQGWQPAKWASYSLDPSNPTYRETVLHLPDADQQKIGRLKELEARRADRNTRRQMSEREVEEYYDLRNFFETRQDYPEQNKTGQFYSGHFPEPNIIGHMMTSMTKHEGKPVYTIDQIQSDWGQKLRDGGVRDEAKIKELKERIEQVRNDLRALWSNLAKDVRPLDGESVDDAIRLGRGGDPDMRARYNRRQDEGQLLQAELRTAEAATPGNPLVNTTDQWVNTTLRRAIRQAAEADADYIAIPSGDTVLSYNPGDTDGMRGFYDGIVPKNLRNLLTKIDKASPSPQKIAQLETPTSGLKGKGFTLFPLTDAVKRSVIEEGQPMFAFAGPKATTARRDMLKIAERMEGRGGKPDHIFKQTGWFRGHDKRWRFEIDDSNALLQDLDTISKPWTNRPKGAPTGRDLRIIDGRPLKDVLDHPALFAAYQFLEKMPVRVIYGDSLPKDLNETGQFSLKQRGNQRFMSVTVRGRTVIEVHRALLHELQHYIQTKEGWDSGANPKHFTPGGIDPTRLYRGQNLFPLTRGERMVLWHEERLQDLQRDHAEGRMLDLTEDDLLRSINKAAAEKMRVGERGYVKSPGEAEANLTMERGALTAAERRQSFPMKDWPHDLDPSSPMQFTKWVPAIEAAQESLARTKGYRKRHFAPRMVSDRTRMVRQDHASRTEDFIQFEWLGHEGQPAVAVAVREYPFTGTAEYQGARYVTDRDDISIMSLSPEERAAFIDDIERGLRERNLRMRVNTERMDHDQAAWWWARNDAYGEQDPRRYVSDVEDALYEKHGSGLVLKPGNGYGEDWTYSVKGLFGKLKEFKTDDYGKVTEVPIDGEELWSIINAARRRRGEISRSDIADQYRGIDPAIIEDMRRDETGAPVMFAFAGPNARTADLEALSRAKQMAEDGADRKTIWQETGWFRGVDGKWRWEIDDSGAALGRKRGRLDRVLRHSGLFAAYLEVGNIKAWPIPGLAQLFASGGYREASGFRKWLGSRGEMAHNNSLDTILHEAQHAIQREEGTATGGHWRDAADTLTPENERMLVEYEATKIAQHRFDVENPSWRRKKKGFDQDNPWDIADEVMQRPGILEKPEVERVPMALSILARSEREFPAAAHIYRQASDILRQGTPRQEPKMEVTQADRDTAREGLARLAYKHLAGEVEARAVEARMSMTPEERRAVPPWDSYDVPEDQQIVRFADGTQASSEPMFAMGDRPVTPGLDMSPEARKARAEQMGFDTSRVWYHGTRSADPFDAFRRDTSKSNEVAGIYLTANPRFAEGQIGATRVLELYTRLSKPLVIGRGGEPIEAADSARLRAAGVNSMFERFDSAAVAERLGYDHVVQYDQTLKKPSWIVVFDPKNIRSINAAFDPANADSSNLMFAMGDRPQQETPDYTPLIRSYTDAYGAVLNAAAERGITADSLPAIVQAMTDQVGPLPERLAAAQQALSDLIGPDATQAVVNAIAETVPYVPGKMPSINPNDLLATAQRVIDALAPPDEQPQAPKAANDNFGVETPLVNDLQEVAFYEELAMLIGACRA